MADPRATAYPQPNGPADDGFGDDPLAELTRIVADNVSGQPAWTPPRPGGRFGRATPQMTGATARQPASARLPPMERYVPPPEPVPAPPAPPVMAEPEPEFLPEPEPAPVPVAPPAAAAPRPRPPVRPLFPTAAQAALDARAGATRSVAQESYAFFSEQRSRTGARSWGDPESGQAPSAPAAPDMSDDPLAELARLASDPGLFERSFRRPPQPAPEQAYDPVAEEAAGYYEEPASSRRGDLRARGGAAVPPGYHDDDAADLAGNQAPVGTTTVDAYVPGDLESHAVPEVEDARPAAAGGRYAAPGWDDTPAAPVAATEPYAAADPYYDDAPVWRDPSTGEAIGGHDEGLRAGSLEAGVMPVLPGEEEPRKVGSFSSMKGVLAIVSVLAVALVGLVGYRMAGSHVSGGAPQVFEDDGLPMKGPPANAVAEGEGEGEQPGKTIYDRVDGKTDASSARLVERPLPPVEALPGVAGASVPDAAGGTVMEPRRVRTVVVRPDGTIMPGQTADPTAVPETAADTLPEPVPAADRNAMADLASGGSDLAALPQEEPAAAEAAAVIPETPVGSPQGPLRLPERRPAAPAARTAAAAPVAAAPAPVTTAPAPAAPATAGGPMSLIPGSVRPTTQTAAAPVATVTPAAGSYLVQVTSQRSQEQALAAYRQLQSKFPSILGGRAPSIQSVNLGAKGTYYRVRVPAGSQAQAAQLCSQLKSAGGDCVVTR